MSIDPAGTILDDDRLLEFRKTETTTVGELALEVLPVADAMGAESDEHVDWGINEYEDESMLVVTAERDTHEWEVSEAGTSDRS